MSGQPSGVAQFFGYAMIAVGVLIMLMSGGCTLVAVFIAITEKNMSGLLGAALIVGLPFIAIGLGLFVGGRSLARRRGGPPPDRDVF